MGFLQDRCPERTRFASAARPREEEEEELEASFFLSSLCFFSSHIIFLQRSQISNPPPRAMLNARAFDLMLVSLWCWLALFPSVTASFSGVKLNLTISSLARNWSECWSESFAGHLETSLESLKERCNLDDILVACRDPTKPNELRVAANAPRSDVFFDVGDDTRIVSRLANGVQWYFARDSSMGFAPGVGFHGSQ